MFYAFGGSKTLVKHTFFIMILTWDKQKHWQAPKKPKKTKPLDAPNIDRHQKKQKFQQLLRSGPIETTIPATTQKWTHSSWNFSFFGFFGACAGLVHLVVCFFCFFWCLCRFGDSDFTKHRQAPKKTKKQKIQQLLRSGPIVPGNFSFCWFFWCLCRFGASSGLFFCFFWCLCRFGDSDFTKHWQAPKKPKTTNH